MVAAATPLLPDCWLCTEEELALIGEQHPFEPFHWLPETLRLDFQEGIKMLQAAGREVTLA